MSDHGVLANLETLEGSVSQETPLTLIRKSRKIVITNDHAVNNLNFKFNNSENFATLQGTETLSLYFTTKLIIIDGNGPYRIWVFG